MAIGMRGPQERGETPLDGFELSAVANKSKGLNQFVLDHKCNTNWPFSSVVLNSAPSAAVIPRRPGYVGMGCGS